RLEAAREKQSRALERVRRIGLNHVEAAAEGLRQRLAQIVLDALDGDALGLRRIADAIQLPWIDIDRGQLRDRLAHPEIARGDADRKGDHVVVADTKQ